MYNGDGREYQFKVIFLGDRGVGKTSIRRRSVLNSFKEIYKKTIGMDFALKIINWNANTVVRLHIWNVAGDALSGTMTEIYFKGVVGAVVVIDATKGAVLKSTQDWITDLKAKLKDAENDNFPIMIAVNKWDLVNENHKANIQEAVKKLAGNNGIPVDNIFYTSAKEENTEAQDYTNQIDALSNKLVEGCLSASPKSIEDDKKVKVVNKYLPSSIDDYSEIYHPGDNAGFFDTHHNNRCIRAALLTNALVKLKDNDEDNETACAEDRFAEDSLPKSIIDTLKPLRSAIEVENFSNDMDNLIDEKDTKGIIQKLEQGICPNVKDSDNKIVEGRLLELVSKLTATIYDENHENYWADDENRPSLKIPFFVYLSKVYALGKKSGDLRGKIESCVDHMLNSEALKVDETANIDVKLMSLVTKINPDYLGAESDFARLNLPPASKIDVSVGKKISHSMTSLYNYVSQDKRTTGWQKNNFITDQIILSMIPGPKCGEDLIQKFNEKDVTLGMIVSCNEDLELRGVASPGNVVNPEFWQLRKIEQIRFKIADYGTEIINDNNNNNNELINDDNPNKSINKMHEVIKEGKGVVVHCKAGKGRSPLIVAVYLALFDQTFEGDTLSNRIDNIYKHVKEKRDPTINADRAHQAAVKSFVEAYLNSDFVHEDAIRWELSDETINRTTPAFH